MVPAVSVAVSEESEAAFNCTEDCGVHGACAGDMCDCVKTYAGEGNMSLIGIWIAGVPSISRKRLNL